MKIYANRPINKKNPWIFLKDAYMRWLEGWKGKEEIMQLFYDLKIKRKTTNFEKLCRYEYAKFSN